MQFIATEMYEERELRILMQQGSLGMKHIYLLKELISRDFAGNTLECFLKKVKIHARLASNVKGMNGRMLQTFRIRAIPTASGS